MMMAPTEKPWRARIVELASRCDRWMFPVLVAFFICPLSASLVDPWLAIYLHDHRTSWIVKAAQWATDFGNAWRYLIGLAVLFVGSYIFKNATDFRNRCIYVFVTICSSCVFTEALAFIIGRSRPKLLLEQGTYGLSLLNGFKPFDSLPSSHASSVLSFVFAAALVLPGARNVLLVYGFLLATTRILINAHYFGDVVASAAVSGATALYLLRYLPEPRKAAPRPSNVITMRKAQ